MPHVRCGCASLGLQAGRLQRPTEELGGLDVRVDRLGALPGYPGVPPGLVEPARVEEVEREELRMLVGGGSGDPLDRLSDPGPQDLVFEVTGTGPGLDLAMASAVPGTRVVLIGLQDGPARIEPRQLSLGEMELIGTNAHVFSSDFADAVRLLASRASGWSDIAPIAFPLEDLVEKGLAPMAEGRAEAIKTLIDPWVTEARPTA